MLPSAEPTDSLFNGHCEALLMQQHEVRTYPSAQLVPRERQLAWKIAEVAADPVATEPEVAEMIVNRLIDVSAVAIAAIDRHAVISARAMALAHTRRDGATVYGVASEQRYSPEWAAWANGTAVRELDMHDTFLAADFGHPADNIPAVLAVAQSMGRSGRDLIRGIATAYEIQINLIRSICLHEHGIDHIAHLAPAQAAGIGALLDLPTEVIYQAVQQAVHVSFTTRQSRKGQISSWKAYAPAHAGKLAIEAVDRAMRGEDSPSPIYEGEDGVIARMLGGPAGHYSVPLPAKGEPKRSILESYTKEHSAEYQAQALIDLAFRIRSRISDPSEVEKITIHTSHHTHRVIGSGAGDPQKMDPAASRETLDHSLMYIFAVALEDGRWHHIHSYTEERTHRLSTLRLWRRIETQEDPEWTRRYHSTNPAERAFGGRVEIVLQGGARIVDEIRVANAHPLGAAPWDRSGYRRKFDRLTDGILTIDESSRFWRAAEDLLALPAGQLCRLNLTVPRATLLTAGTGIF